MDAEGQVEVLEGDGVGGEASELVGELGEGGEVLLQGDVEGVGVFDVDGDFGVLEPRLDLGRVRGGAGEERGPTLEYLADVLGCEETAELTLLGLGGHTTQEAAEDDGEDDVRHGP